MIEINEEELDKGDFEVFRNEGNMEEEYFITTWDMMRLIHCTLNGIGKKYIEIMLYNDYTKINYIFTYGGLKICCGEATVFDMVLGLFDIRLDEIVTICPLILNHNDCKAYIRFDEKEPYYDLVDLDKFIMKGENND